MKPRILIVFLIAAGVFASCSPKKEKEPSAKVEDYDPVMKKILLSDAGLFRGTNIGMPLTQVKALEKGAVPSEEEDNYLSYDFAFKDTLQGSYYYSFENGLDEIGVDIYREKSKECLWLFTEMKTYFTKRYGDPKTEDHLLLWYVPNQGKEGAQITLSDESADYGYGKLTLTLFPFQSEVDPKDKEAKPQTE
jgi:hypothetical protein